MPDFTVIRYGTDTSGRAIYGTRYMVSVWERILAHPDVEPFADKLTIVQGAFMARNGGGAAASAGYHDEGGCWDIRTWNLTAAELATFIRVARLYGWAFWRRDAQHGGMDSHAHGVLGTDRPLAPGAAWQWQEYLAGHDGLASRGPDYEPRPRPLVTDPPEADVLNADDKNWLAKTIKDEVAAGIEKAMTTEQSNGATLRENIRNGGNARDFAKAIAKELGLGNVRKDQSGK